MLAVVLAASVILALPQTGNALSPRPTDEEMIAAMQAGRPGARTLSYAFSDLPRGGGRVGCGLIDMAGTVEPFSVLAAWTDRSEPVVRLEGAPHPPPEVPHWKILVSAPFRVDHDGDGVMGRGDRNIDVLQRRMALRICDDLRPPAGVTWAMELEADPDPAHAARTQERTKQAMKLIFGPREPHSLNRPD